ncbi:DapH/DapD/GlmU-related protein [Arthrobacter sp. S39]|uniref:DapH/DapD/GlmU-related protein n=1 Tax=Arthrobacter sp. S39 TaxID=2509720 RepID=UPI0010373B91|nr:DapH/DapD/GlmU-related protein [Arthrobacter sp. S39]TAP41167.1 transferase [Arthrobacter sp. S39]
MSTKFESVEDDAGRVIRYRRHPNGGGFVGPGAYVAESARLGSMTYVEPGARIGSGSRVGHGSWIDRLAQVGERTVIGDGVRVGHGTVIGNRVHIGSHSRIGSGAVIEHGTSVNADSTVPDGGHVAAEPRRRSRAAPAKRAQPRQRKSQNRQAA